MLQTRDAACAARENKLSEYSLPNMESEVLLIGQSITTDSALFHVGDSAPTCIKRINSSSGIPNNCEQTYSVCSPRRGAGALSSDGVFDRRKGGAS